MKNKEYEGSCEGCSRLKRLSDRWKCNLIGTSSPMEETKFPYAMCGDGRIDKRSNRPSTTA